MFCLFQYTLFVTIILTKMSRVLKFRKTKLNTCQEIYVHLTAFRQKSSEQGLAGKANPGSGPEQTTYLKVDGRPVNKNLK